MNALRMYNAQQYRHVKELAEQMRSDGYTVFFEAAELREWTERHFGSGWFNGLTDVQRDAIRTYIKFAVTRINPRLRAGGSLAAAISNFVSCMDSVMVPLPEPVAVVREYFYIINYVLPETLTKLQARLDQLEPGAEFHDRGYTSTSLKFDWLAYEEDPDELERPRNVTVIRVPAGVPVVLAYKTIRPDVRRHELVLPRGSRFTVVARPSEETAWRFIWDWTGYDAPGGDPG